MASIKCVQDTLSDPDNAKACGLAIIVANSYQAVSPLYGTHVDAERMKKAFTTLKFAIHLELDITKDRMEKLGAEAAQCTFPDTCRCIAFVFAGHGNNKDPNDEKAGQHNFIMDEKWQAVSTMRIIHSFFPPTETPENVPEIAKFPKLFFFDACRGGEAMKRVTVSRGEAEPIPLKYPTQGNYLVAYSTVPDYEAYELIGGGGVWMSELAELLPTSNFPVESVVTQAATKVEEFFEHKSQSGKMQRPQALLCLSGTYILTNIAGLSLPADPSKPPPNPPKPGSAGATVLDQTPELYEFTYWENKHTKDSFRIIDEIQAYWTQLANALQLPDRVVRNLQATPINRPADNCREVFKKWLNARSDQYKTPKTWNTVIEVMGIVDDELGAFGERVKKILTGQKV